VDDQIRLSPISSPIQCKGWVHRVTGDKTGERGQVFCRFVESPNARRELSRAFRPPHRGLSLLEVILAIAILAGAMVVLGQLVRIGTRASQGARDLTQAQLRCESIMAEILAGAAEPEPVTRAEVPDDPDWLYSIGLEATDQEGLVLLRVTVEQNLPGRKRPRGFSLVRWISDPGIELPEEAEMPQPEEEPAAAPDEPDDSGGVPNDR
jgi:prepilin-type N-terminal cleavage/methylation domain-containing protein